MVPRHSLGHVPARFRRGVLFDSYLHQAERPQSRAANDQAKRVARSLCAIGAKGLLVGALLFSSHAFAAGVTNEIPEHATTARYGGGLGLRPRLS